MLVGRDDEVAALDRLLAALDTPLLTLTGPPGVGKSRLAIAVAAGVAARFSDGVAYVDLAEVRDPEMVPGAVLEAVGSGAVGTANAADHLVRVLTDKNMLLVLDNFEHVLDAGPAVTAALAASGGLRLMVTSRERLHLRAEREVPVPPLGLPREGDDLDRVAAAPAVQMLVQRVRRFAPEFDLTQANRAAVAEICARVDGLPLAVELAAARFKLFTPGELTVRLRHRMGILIGTARDVPRRHRTLRAAFTWSHDLLKPDEQAAFRRLSVFVGGATLDAAGQVCGLDDPVATITSLVDKSVLQRRTRPDGVAAFGMLESLREYAVERLVEHGEEDAVRARHARYYADLAVLVETAIGEAAEAEWAESVGFEQGNLRKALAYGTATLDAGLALPIASALGWYAYTRGRLGGQPVPLDRACAVVDRGQPQAPGNSLGGVLLIAAGLAFGRGDLDDAEALLTRVLTVEDDQWHTAIATAFRGHLARARGHDDQAIGYHVRAADLFSALGNGPGLAWSRYDLALLARHRGDADGAVAHLREVLKLFREMGDTHAIACATWTLLTAEAQRDRGDGAERLLVEARRCCGSAQDGLGVATCLEGLSMVGCIRREPRDVVRRLSPPERPGVSGAPPDGGGRSARPRRDSDPADAARDGARRPLRAAGLGRGGSAVRVPPGKTSSVGVLTVRECQVARLVADGSTNRQIGKTLGIAEKTTEVHVHNIIRKLGAQNRAEVAARVSAHDRPR